MKKAFRAILMLVAAFPLCCVGEPSSLRYAVPGTPTARGTEIGKAAPAKFEQCWAATKSVNRCKRRAVAGERYCRQHSAAREPKIAPERCRSMTTNGVQCVAVPMPKSSYCKDHQK